MTLLVLAAGMGSRFGGIKQLTPLTNEGEYIIDFTVYDAIKAGFDKVVFVIKRENLDEFVSTIGKRFVDKIKVEYTFQDIDDLPEGYSVPEGRTKPWGTAHALLSARDAINEPFAVINADDFYGRGAYELLFKHLSTVDSCSEKASYCMVGYVLENTLTENGTVSRGICEVNESKKLVAINERTAIKPAGDHAVYAENGVDVSIPLDSIASMNCWGFTPDIFGHLERIFEEFLKTPTDNPLKRECYLPMSVGEIMNDGLCDVTVYETSDQWYGVTYHEDKEKVKASINKLINDGVYPNKLN